MDPRYKKIDRSGAIVTSHASTRRPLRRDNCTARLTWLGIPIFGHIRAGLRSELIGVAVTRGQKCRESKDISSDDIGSKLRTCGAKNPCREGGKVEGKREERGGKDPILSPLDARAVRVTSVLSNRF